VRDYRQLLALSDDELAQVDPLVMNLLVARDIPSLAHLNIGRYQQMRDEWAEGVRKRLPHADKVFARDPGAWKNDINFLRLGVLCEYLADVVGIAYIEEQRELKTVPYTNPSDLFLNGVMDRRRGTCGNMSALHLVVGRKLGWPLSLACAAGHVFVRYDDGRVKYNLESSHTGLGGWSSPEDQSYIDDYRLTRKAIQCGSDMTGLGPRETLGLWIGLRARHLHDSGHVAESEADYLLARHLFPVNHNLYFKGTWATVERGAELFDPGEEGSPPNLAETILRKFGPHRVPVRRADVAATVDYRDAIFIEVGRNGRNKR